MPKTKKTVKTTPKKTVKKENKKPYHLEIRVNDMEFKTDAKDVETALNEFLESPQFPFGSKTSVFITLTKGNKKLKRLWHTPEARRVFRQIQLKPEALNVLATKFNEQLG